MSLVSIVSSLATFVSDASITDATPSPTPLTASSASNTATPSAIPYTTEPAWHEKEFSFKYGSTDNEEIEVDVTISPPEYDLPSLEPEPVIPPDSENGGYDCDPSLNPELPPGYCGDDDKYGDGTSGNASQSSAPIKDITLNIYKSATTVRQSDVVPTITVSTTSSATGSLVMGIAKKYPGWLNWGFGSWSDDGYSTSSAESAESATSTYACDPSLNPELPPGYCGDDYNVVLPTSSRSSVFVSGPTPLPTSITGAFSTISIATVSSELKNSTETAIAAEYTNGYRLITSPPSASQGFEGQGGRGFGEQDSGEQGSRHGFGGQGSGFQGSGAAPGLGGQGFGGQGFGGQGFGGQGFGGQGFGGQGSGAAPGLAGGQGFGGQGGRGSGSGQGYGGQGAGNAPGLGGQGGRGFGSGQGFGGQGFGGQGFGGQNGGASRVSAYPSIPLALSSAHLTAPTLPTGFQRYTAAPTATITAAPTLSDAEIADYSRGYSDGWHNALTSDGFVEGFDIGEQDGYSSGYNVGYRAALSGGPGAAFTQGYLGGENHGYYTGYIDGEENKPFDYSLTYVPDVGSLANMSTTHGPYTSLPIATFSVSASREGPYTVDSAAPITITSTGFGYITPTTTAPESLSNSALANPITNLEPSLEAETNQTTDSFVSLKARGIKDSFIQGYQAGIEDNLEARLSAKDSSFRPVELYGDASSSNSYGSLPYVPAANGFTYGSPYYASPYGSGSYAGYSGSGSSPSSESGSPFWNFLSSVFCPCNWFGGRDNGESAGGGYSPNYYPVPYYVPQPQYQQPQPQYYYYQQQPMYYYYPVAAGNTYYCPASTDTPPTPITGGKDSSQTTPGSIPPPYDSYGPYQSATPPTDGSFPSYVPYSDGSDGTYSVPSVTSDNGSGFYTPSVNSYSYYPVTSSYDGSYETPTATAPAYSYYYPTLSDSYGSYETSAITPAYSYAYPTAVNTYGSYETPSAPAYSYYYPTGYSSSFASVPTAAVTASYAPYNTVTSATVSNPVDSGEGGTSQYSPAILVEKPTPVVVPSSSSAARSPSSSAQISQSANGSVPKPQLQETKLQSAKDLVEKHSKFGPLVQNESSQGSQPIPSQIPQQVPQQIPQQIPQGMRRGSPQASFWTPQYSENINSPEISPPVYRQPNVFQQPGFQNPYQQFHPYGSLDSQSMQEPVKPYPYQLSGSPNYPVQSPNYYENYMRDRQVYNSAPRVNEYNKKAESATNGAEMLANGVPKLKPSLDYDAPRLNLFDSARI